jgi:hypothetical protein
MAHPHLIEKRSASMSTILVINAVSSLLATVGIGGLVVWRDRRVRRAAIVQPLYVTTIRRRPCEQSGHHATWSGG